MRYEVTLDEIQVRVDLTPEGRFVVDERVVAADVRERFRGRLWSVTLDGESHEVTLLTYAPLRLDVDGVFVRASVIDKRTQRASRAASAARTGRIEIRAPMPGLLKTVHVAEGDRVERDAPLATLEAMKMENELRAPAAGRVTRVAAGPGSKIEGGAVLIVIASD